MELIASYRPLSGSLVVWDSELSDARRDNDDCITTHNNTSDDWTIGLTTFRGKFVGMTFLGIDDDCRDWSLWLSFYLPDDVVGRIADTVSVWQDEFTQRSGNARYLAHYKTVIAV
jgi:hypothetical protein